MDISIPGAEAAALSVVSVSLSSIVEIEAKSCCREAKNALGTALESRCVVRERRSPASNR